MGRCVIKTAFMAASLGLAWFVSSPALATTDDVLLVCKSNSSGEKMLIDRLYSSVSFEGFPQLKVGEECMPALGFFTDNGFIVLKEEFEGISSSSFQLAPSQPTIFASEEEAKKSIGKGGGILPPPVYLYVHLRCPDSPCL